MTSSNQSEPWLRGTHADVAFVQRAAVHALESAVEDLTRWCAGLSGPELNARPAGVASVAFHLRHIPGSIDRLLTYAEGLPLSESQRMMLQTEQDGSASSDELLSELQTAIATSIERIKEIPSDRLEEVRFVGRKKLPTTVGSLLVHIAEHTQRHVGQAIVTARVARTQPA